jgi:signal transduction histidine kinase/ligand-binding sensor protein
MKYAFSDLVDVDQLRPLLEGFTNATGAATAVLDIEGTVLVATGWSEICTRFHRRHPTTCARCIESDTILAGGVKRGERYNLYQCRNGLVDVAMPIIVEGIHVGNIFTGQFLLEPPDPERFRAQAAEFGFDEAAYLDALAKVPVFTRDQITGTIDFLSSLVEIIGTMGLAKKRLLAANAELSIRNRIADVFLTAAEPDIHQEVLHIVLDAMDSPQGGIGCLDENGHLTCRASVGTICAQCPATAGNRESWDGGLCFQAMTEKKTVCSNQPTPRIPDGTVLARRHVCLPIVYRENVIGLVLAADKAADYDENDLRMLDDIGDYVAPILDARLEANRQERDRRRAEEGRENLIARLEVQNAELERFAYTVSHDLKTPLITMQGFLGVLKEDMANEDARGVENDLRRMEGAAKVMTGLLGDLVNLSRIGRLVQPSRDVSLRDLAREAVELASGIIAARGVQVEIEPDLPVVFGDHRRLLEVLQNLIENAVKYMGDQPRPRIEIGASQRDGQWLCHVRDNGIGIDPRYHEKIFDLFEQLDPNSDGSGIGLALVKRIVEIHGGRIWVESDGLGRGATFYFTLPREPVGSLTAG